MNKSLLRLLLFLSVAAARDFDLAGAMVDATALSRLEDAAAECHKLPIGSEDDCELIRTWRSADPAALCPAWVSLTFQLPGNRDKQDMRDSLLRRCEYDILPSILRFQKLFPPPKTELLDDF